MTKDIKIINFVLFILGICVLLFMATLAFSSDAHKVRRGQSLWLIAKIYGMSVKELKDINNIKSNFIHPGDLLEIRPKEYKAVASWYGRKFHGRKMANGKIFDMTAASAAHKTLPLGAVVKITNINTSKSVILTITDRGPYIKGRDFDLSHEAARQIGMVEKGVEKIKIKILLP